MVTRQTCPFNNQSAATSDRHSLSLTEPSIPSKTLSLLMSRWMTWLAWRKSKACKHCTCGGKGSRTGTTGLVGGYNKERDFYFLVWAVPLGRQQLSGLHPCRSPSLHQLASHRPSTPSPQTAPLPSGNCHTNTHHYILVPIHFVGVELIYSQGCVRCHLSKKLTMLGFFNSFMTRISLMISSFLGCFCRLICLIATCEQDATF